jgi:uncharacterized protein with HEPN domain
LSQGISAAISIRTKCCCSLVRAIEVIGEAASKLSADTRSATPSVPWWAIVAMRNRLIHAYFDIDRDILWKTVSEELPALLPLLRALGPVPYPS